MDRIIGAFTFRDGIYAEVEHDESFTQSAWLIVVVVSFLNQLGASATTDIGSWVIGAILGTIVAVIGFAISTFLIDFAARTFFDADVTFNELVRTLGLAYVWNVIGVFGFVGVLIPGLSCVVGLASLVGFILLLVAWYMALQEALDLGCGGVFISLLIAFVIYLVLQLIVGVILGALGLTVAGIGALFGAGG